jgi:hypothetical protein
MTRTEFYAGLAVLTAAGAVEMGERTEQLYFERLRGLPDGAFAAGISALVEGPEFAELVQYRRLPTLHELRAACQAAIDTPRGRPYVGDVPLPELLRSIPPDSRKPLPEEAGALVERVAARARRTGRLLPGPGTAAHRGPVKALSAPQLTDAEWEARRRRLLEQRDELLGAGERVS